MWRKTGVRITAIFSDKRKTGEMYMNFFKKIVLFLSAFNIILLLFVGIRFHVDDMTLSKGDVYEFNEEWILTWPDGESIEISELPYLGTSQPGEVLVLENTIPKEYCGMTMSFLSADKTLKVWIDGEYIYEFGVADRRIFGHTAGSVMNYIDIPDSMSEGKLRIEMCSPYPDYGARVSKVTIGERDVLILQLLQDNILNIACNLVICFCGFLFFMLCLVKKMSGQNMEGVQYLCGYCVVTCLYYFVETKTLQIFFGNQTFYSVLVFLCVMMIPFFICLYYANGELGIFKKRWSILLGLNCANIFVQMVLQLLNIVDFMNMAFLSHSLICLTVLVTGKSYLDILREKKEVKVRLGLAALLFMGGGGAIDIVRMYIVAVGDMGKFSRIGTMCFCIIMLYQHFSLFIKEYTNNMEEHAKFLQRDMEVIERKNEELRRANELAEEARQDALSANAAKGKFLAHMSHEIRTPINAVLGMDTMILRETTDMQIKEYALDIQNAGQNLLALINDILDFSKIESGKLEIICVEYDLSSMIHDISNMVKAKAAAKKLELNICVDENLPSRLWGDDVRIRQVLINLLNNAVKYTSEGSVTLSVQGKVEDGKVFFDFSVQDTGIGIKEEDISKLFLEFERIEEKRNRNIEGTGLGMNIATQILMLMGSRMNVESVYGKGSKFYFTLEQQIVDSTPIGNLEERIRKQSTEYNYTETFEAPDAQILVVDDNLTNLKVFVSLLKRTKVKVDVVDSGKACLEMVAQKYYDCIFLDHMMPEMDGIETLHRLKELENNQCVATPVVALTANAITGAKEMYMAEGFDAFLPKPINPEKLEQMILRLLPRELLHFEKEGKETVKQIPEKMVDNDSDISADNSGDMELPMVDGIDWTYGLMHLPTRELLAETVADFYKMLDVEAESLEKFYQESKKNIEALQQYRIKVHSMKSSANLIGAIVLGGMAKVLENAARDYNMKCIIALHDIFLVEWRSYKEKLKDYGQPADEKVEVTDYTEILAYLEMLHHALEEFEMDEMDRLMNLLENFQYPDNMQNAIQQLGAHVLNMDTGQAEAMIEKIKKLVMTNEEWRNER